jgi:hypothetical protein
MKSPSFKDLIARFGGISLQMRAESILFINLLTFYHREQTVFNTLKIRILRKAMIVAIIDDDRCL